MMDVSAAVRVSDHAFGLLDGGDLPIGTADHSTGLVVVMSAGALIYTGIDTGTVHVGITLATQPVDLDPETPWEDIVEAGVHAPRGDLRLDSLETGPVAVLPVLSQDGPGWYRLRAFVRGRDAHFDAVHDDPGELYHLHLWPAPPAPAVLIRTTDRCGAGLRSAPPTPSPPPEPPPQRTRDRLDQAIRKATGRPPA
ncbi:unnamed protein product [[Actinomadura] parvosata subsp. kistnae]|uniref:Uncharacterized protein n=1 Tax=[Actinomadura] parvosata subsp. kistnae TaxID=1909395 RepID=A0A1V0A4P4_9ACTN|nr:hypothetical protein [Nonomuraea sp. ATCC 55076]AQZ65122.1 hypothetical protein BKM31_30055 [Nonomuraea sp. ATCC 55076]SPL96406.1 unnamed protein product [Actinomadura parvosata subsp. kistnae]